MTVPHITITAPAAMLEIQANASPSATIRMMVGENRQVGFLAKHVADDVWRVELTLEGVDDPVVDYQLECIDNEQYTLLERGKLIRSKRSDSVKVLPFDEPLITSQYGGEMTPTNQLLKPEYAPPQGTVKTAQAEKDDQQINHTRLGDISSSHIPGESTDPEPDESTPRADDPAVDVFDPRLTAMQVIQKVIGSREPVPSKGRLFSRSPTGEPVVEGIGSPEIRRKQHERAQAVKKILGE